MATTNLSPNMNLPVPAVGLDPGPQWASDLNSCLTLVDQHNHSSGSGVQITPSGLNINGDLPLNNNNLTLVRSVRMQVQGATLTNIADRACIYAVGVDLYFTDGNGNAIRITQSGGIAGTPGAIANLSSPASATYVAANQTFVWQSAANTAANLDAGFLILRNSTANSKGLTLSAPAAMGANYTITFPSLPAQTNVVTLDSSGNMGSVAWDAVGQNMTSVGANAIGATMTPTGANSVANTRTRSTSQTVGIGGVAISPGVGTAGFSSTSVYGTITFSSTLSVTITTTGRPVRVVLTSDGTSFTGFSGKHSAAISGNLGGPGCVGIFRDGTAFSNAIVLVDFGSGGLAVEAIDTPSAGTHIYQIGAFSWTNNSPSVSISDARLIAYEL